MAQTTQWLCYSELWEGKVEHINGVWPHPEKGMGGRAVDMFNLIFLKEHATTAWFSTFISEGSISI